MGHATTTDETKHKGERAVMVAAEIVHRASTGAADALQQVGTPTLLSDCVCREDRGSRVRRHRDATKGQLDKHSIGSRRGKKFVR